MSQLTNETNKAANKTSQGLENAIQGFFADYKAFAQQDTIEVENLHMIDEFLTGTQAWETINPKTQDQLMDSLIGLAPSDAESLPLLKRISDINPIMVTDDRLERLMTLQYESSYRELEETVRYLTLKNIESRRLPPQRGLANSQESAPTASKGLSEPIQSWGN